VGLSAAPSGAAADVAVGLSPGDLPARLFTLEVAFQAPLPDPNDPADTADVDPAAAAAAVAAAPPAALPQPSARAPSSKANRRKRAAATREHNHS
jgi:hypothetical protein